MRLADLQVPIDFAGRRRLSLEHADLEALRDVFPSVGAYATGSLNLASGPEPRRVNVTFVTTDFFATLARDAVRAGRADGGHDAEHEARRGCLHRLIGSITRCESSGVNPPRSVILRAAPFAEAEHLAHKFSANHEPAPAGILVEPAPQELLPLQVRIHNGVVFMVTARVQR